MSYLLEHHLIPKSEMNRVFRESYSAAAEIGPDFMCFEEPYQAAVRVADKDSIILDLGCAYAPQAYYFSKCKHYIGVDLPMTLPENPFNYPNIKPETRFHPDNARFYIMTIQQFIQTVLPKLKLDINHVIAVCSAVPDVQARQLVIDTFPVHYVSYPGQKTYSTLPPPKKTLEEALGLEPVKEKPMTLLDMTDIEFVECMNKDEENNGKGMTHYYYTLPITAYSNLSEIYTSHCKLRLDIALPYCSSSVNDSLLTLDVVTDNGTLLSSIGVPKLTLQPGIDYEKKDIERLLNMQYIRKDILRGDYCRMPYAYDLATTRRVDGVVSSEMRNVGDMQYIRKEDEYER